MAAANEISADTAVVKRSTYVNNSFTGSRPETKFCYITLEQTPSGQAFPAGEPQFVRLHLHTQSSSPACVCGHTTGAPLSREEPGSQRTSLRSAMVRFMPASCFHTGSARFRLRGLPVRIAMPSSTPADTARRSALRTDPTTSRQRAQERIRRTKLSRDVTERS